MNPQDDPEARIRDLERPLTDVARTSELGTGTSESGTGQYSGGYVNAAPPPPPQGSYGTPYPPAPPQGSYGTPYPPAYTSAPPRGTGGFSWWWLIVATFVVGAVAVGAGIAVFNTNLFSSVGSISSSPGHHPNISGGGGTLTNAPTGRPVVPGSTIQAPTAEPPVSVLTPGDSFNVSGIGANKTIACNDSIVSVSGMNNTVVVTGHCVSLTVSGMDNVITVDSADTIGASGFDNRVTFKSGSPEVNNSGGGNVVEQG
jgi:hypothetical protein